MADMLISETLFFEMKDALSWYANADWGWNELGEGVVGNWDQHGTLYRPDHDPKDGGNVARKTLERISLLLHHPF